MLVDFKPERIPRMYKTTLFILLILNTINTIAQPQKNSKIFNNFSIMASAGASMVLTEYKTDRSGFINEMKHLPGYTFSIGFAKTITHNFDLGIEYEQSTFNGFQNNPDFSAYHFGHYKISLMRIEPVVYNTEIQNLNITLTYYFNSKKKKRAIPFIYIKGGPTKLTSYLSYKSTHEIIFAKIGRDETMPNASIYVDNFNLGGGFGNEIVVNPKLSLKIQADISNINDDNLDAVHNFNAPPPEGYQNFVSGLYTRVQIGLSYNLNPDRQRIAERKYRLKDSFNKKQKKRQLFPWYKK